MDQKIDRLNENENLHVVCRLCSAKENLISLFKGKNKSNRDYIRKLVAITIGVKYHHDDYLDLICLSCVLQVYNMYVFWTKSRENEESLQILVQDYTTKKRDAKELSEIELPDFTELKNLMTIWIFAKQSNNKETNKSTEKLDEGFSGTQFLTPPLSTIFMTDEIIQNNSLETSNVEIETDLQPDFCHNESQTEVFTSKEASTQCELLKAKVIEFPKHSRRNKNVYIQCELLKTENYTGNGNLTKNLMNVHTQTIPPFEKCDESLFKSFKSELLGCVHQKLNAIVKVSGKKDDKLIKNNMLFQNFDKIHTEKAAVGLEFFLQNKSFIDQKNEGIKRDFTESKFKNKKFKSNDNFHTDGQKILEGEQQPTKTELTEKESSDNALNNSISVTRGKKRTRQVKENKTSTSYKTKREKFSYLRLKGSKTDYPLIVNDDESVKLIKTEDDIECSNLFDNEHSFSLLSGTRSKMENVENNDTKDSQNSEKIKFLQSLNITFSCGDNSKYEVEVQETDSPHSKYSCKSEQNIYDQNYVINNSQEADLLTDVKLEQESPICQNNLHTSLVLKSSPSYHDGSPSVQSSPPHSSSPRSSRLLKVSEKVDYLKHCSECSMVIYTKEEMSVHLKIHKICRFCKTKFRSIKKTKEHMASGCIGKICLNKVTVPLLKFETCQELVDKYPHCLLQMTPRKQRKRSKRCSCDQGISESVKKKLILS